MNFDSERTLTPDELDGGSNLSLTRHTPVSADHRFSLPDYNLSGGPASLDSGYNEYGGSFAEEDDILLYADDAENLNFSLDATPIQSRKRASRDPGSNISKRTRHTSDDDETIQRIARDDHNSAFQSHFYDFKDEMGGIGDVRLDEYRPLDPLMTELDQEHHPEEEVVPRPMNKRRRLIIVEDESVTVPSEDFRNWPKKYSETQAILISRKRKAELARIAKEKAAKYLKGWGGRDCASLHPLLQNSFICPALAKRWNKKPPNATNKENYHDGGTQAELAIDRFGNGTIGLDGLESGAFDSLDYGVLSALNRSLTGDGHWTTCRRRGRPFFYSNFANAVE